MKKLVLATVLLGGFLWTAGCVIASDPNLISGDFQVSWSVEGECPTDSIAVVTSRNVVTEEDFSMVYRCTDLAGLNRFLPLGNYDTWVEIRDQGSIRLYASSSSVLSSLVSNGELVQVQVPAISLRTEPSGSFDVRWTIEGTCPAQASAELISQDLSTMERFIDIYRCTDGTGLAQQVPLGSYEVWVDIVAADGVEVLGESESAEGTIDTDGQIVSLTVPSISLL